jgi:hypothetical protein
MSVFLCLLYIYLLANHVRVADHDILMLIFKKENSVANYFTLSTDNFKDIRLIISESGYYSWCYLIKIQPEDSLFVRQGDQHTLLACRMLIAFVWKPYFPAFMAHAGTTASVLQNSTTPLLQTTSPSSFSFSYVTLCYRPSSWNSFSILHPLLSYF